MKKSYIFWVIVGFVIQGIMAVVSLDVLYSMWLIGSLIIIFGMMIGGIKEMAEEDYFPFWWWFPITWILVAFGGACYGVFLLVKKPMMYIANKFKQFNNYLNK